MIILFGSSIVRLSCSFRRALLGCDFSILGNLGILGISSQAF
jgi:hypothetical protein